MGETDIAWLADNWTVTGASHRRAGRGNQDAAAVEARDGGRVLIAAVADGHGSRKCYRSDRGARFAVEAAVRHLGDYAAGPAGGDRVAAIRRDTEVELRQRIVWDWQRRVDDDIAAAPPAEAELAGLTDADRASCAANPRVPYGTTLVAALLLPECAVYLQLGDGDALVVGGDGSGPVRPLPADPRSFANDTASLSSPGPAVGGKRPVGGGGPWPDIRVAVVPTAGDPPTLVLLTTDGYPNAFVNDAAFLRVASDLVALTRSEGWAVVAGQMRGWLEEASRQGSGDDVTVVVAVRSDLAGADDGPPPPADAAAPPPAPPTPTAAPDPADESAPEQP